MCILKWRFRQMECPPDWKVRRALGAVFHGRMMKGAIAISLELDTYIERCRFSDVSLNQIQGFCNHIRDRKLLPEAAVAIGRRAMGKDLSPEMYVLLF